MENACSEVVNPHLDPLWFCCLIRKMRSDTYVKPSPTNVDPTGDTKGLSVEASVCMDVLFWRACDCAES